MEGQTRYRLNISKNTRGYGYDFTIDSTEFIPTDLVDEAREFKKLIQAEIKAWTLAEAKQNESSES